MNLAIIGCGLIGQKRAKAVKGHKITWFADVDIEKAKALLRINPEARTTTQWQNVLKDKDLDAVIISTTNDALVPVAVEAIKAKKHVLVEKPAARGVAELKKLIAIAKKNKQVTVKTGFNHRFHPALQKAKQIYDQGALGKPMMIRGRYGHGGRIGYEKEWRAKPKISGGGELIDQGVHLIDLSRWFFGEFTDVWGQLETYFWKMPVEDNAFLHLKTAGGQTAWLHASCTEWKNLFSFEIYGQKGKLHIEGLGGSYGTEKLTFYKMLPQMGPPDTEHWEYSHPDNSWEAEFNEFEKAIREKRVPSGNLQDAYETLKIIDKVYKHASK